MTWRHGSNGARQAVPPPDQRQHPLPSQLPSSIIADRHTPAVCSARAFGLKAVATGVAAALEDRFERAFPALSVRILGYRGAFTGRLWWIASWQEGNVLHTARAEITPEELGDLPMLDVVTLVDSRIRSQIGEA